jgi:FtsP/CotA-like multicopper oxidase with cupredoxin domain
MIATKRVRLGLLLLVGALIVAALPTVAIGRPWQAPAAAGPVGLDCTTGPTFELETATGFISTPDGNSVFMWGYTNAGDGFQMPGPILCVDEGDTVVIELTNTLPEPVSIVFPGQTGVTASVVSAPTASGLFTLEADTGGTVSYTFTAAEPGTYLYESGTEPHKQVQMGLYGVLIVRPALGANYAYNDPDTEFDPGQEYLMLIHDLDPDLHLAVEKGLTYDVTTMHDRYWTINGRSFPDTLADNDVPWLPSQPFGALVHVEAQDPDSLELPALIRYANAGMVNHPFHPHGNHMRVVARDGRMLQGPGGEDASMEAFTKTIGSGQTYDLLFRWINVEEWTPDTNGDIPATIPGLQNLVFKDDLTYYSGDPNLSQTGEFPVGTTIFNQCGEFYFPWHSHALNEFQNFDEGFGGLATLVRVDPPGGCP